MPFFFVLKIFLQSIFVCPTNLFKFCKVPSSDCAGCSVRLYDPVNSIFKSKGNLTSVDEFMPLFKIS